LRTVIDSSFASAALLQEVHTPFVREAAVWSGRLLGPALLPYEIANVMWKAVRQGVLLHDEAPERLREYAGWNLDIELPPDGARHEAILATALQFGLTAYDAAYLEMAGRVDADLATLDDKLARAARKAGLTVHHP